MIVAVSLVVVCEVWVSVAVAVTVCAVLVPVTFEKIVEVPGTVVVPTVLVEGTVVVVKAVVPVVTVGL